MPRPLKDIVNTSPDKTKKTVRAAIIGCGKIADEHAGAIRSFAGSEICAVCDNEPLMAWQMAERLAIPAHYSDAAAMLKSEHPTVVHITTPPGSHYQLARLCLQSGANVLVEKPFALTAVEAADLIQLAETSGLKVTVGHNHQHSPVAVKLRELVRQGFLGGDPVHMESTFPYDLGSGPYAMALLGDKNYWVRKLPGGLAHNVISHGVSKIAEYFQDESPEVITWGGHSRTLRKLGETEIFDELRVIVAGKDGCTAYFTFSSQIKPGRHEFRLFGPKNFLVADYGHQVLIKGENKGYKSYLNFFAPPVLYGRQYLKNAWANFRAFLCRDFHMDTGRRRLVRAFYQSISEGTPVPISYHEILLTAKIMDAIFAHLREQRRSQSPVEAPAESPAESKTLTVR